MSEESFEGQTWCVVLAWRGNDYCGWQIQPNGVSIQSMVQSALTALCGGGYRIIADATGRTDSGVHAEMQYVSFRLPVKRSIIQVSEGLNYHLPPDIRCLSARKMPIGFSPRAWANTKLYRYRILNRIPGCPFRDGVVWHLKQKLNVAAMQEAVVHLEGQNDFSSFRAARCAAQTTVRTIIRATVHDLDDGEVRIEFEGNGFLRHQVRIMVGTLVDVGLGRRMPIDVLHIRDALNRAEAGRTAPAQGLTLVHVELGEGPS
jgi:tRNA pseudouridine38-40 synthase